MNAVVASIPSPAHGVWYLGSFPIRAYALCIIVGIAVAIVIAERRWAARGGERGAIVDLAIWAVPFGIIGGRLYHVLTSWGTYFGADGDPGRAWKVWEGGLGIWGAVAFGALGVWIGARIGGLRVPPVADVVAPGLVVAQAIGRLGNWFNQELFGRPTDVPWGLEIDLAHRPVGYTQYETFHPTFLYELLWCVAVAGILVWADRRYRMGHGRVFALYVVLYCTGRFWIEGVRIDAAPEVLGLRWNEWMSIVIGVLAVVYLIVSARRRPGRETPDELYRDDAKAQATRTSAATTS